MVFSIINAMAPAWIIIEFGFKFAEISDFKVAHHGVSPAD
jgi:hypothetical protein